jgi:hypothetical protein
MPKTPVSNTPLPNTKSPALAAFYATLSFIALIFAGCIGYYIVTNLPEMSKVVNIERPYYVLLVILSLGVAAFLFGALASYATVKGEFMGVAVDLGGPAAIAALVVIGGMINWHAEKSPILIVSLLGGPFTDDRDRQSSIILSAGANNKSYLMFGNNNFYLPLDSDPDVRISTVSLKGDRWVITDPQRTTETEADYTIPEKRIVYVHVAEKTKSASLPPSPKPIERVLFLCAEDHPKTCPQDEFVKCVSPASGNEFDTTTANLSFSGGGGTDKNDHEAYFVREPSKTSICVKMHTAFSGGRNARVDAKLTVIEKVTPNNPEPPKEFAESMPQARRDI